MGRIYTVTFENVAVSAAQDLLQIIGASGKMLRVRRCWWGATDTTLVTSQSMRTRCRYLPVTVSNGSGGGTPAFGAVDPGTPAKSFTALSNNTSQATTSGTAVVLHTSGDHIYNGFDKTFADPPAVGPSESFTMELLSAVSGTVHLSGGAEIEEIGG